jgi:endonuclease/exonuclease/phosphatase (EEP) superfamily protein YafD
MRVRKAFGATVLLVLGTLAAAGAVLGNGGRFSPALDLFAHFAPLYAVAGALAAVHAGVFQAPFRRTTIVAGFISLVASAMLIVPEWTRGTGPEAPATPPGTIKVIQFNALRTNGDIRRVADWQIVQNADIITVTEARHDLRDRLRRAGWKTAGSKGSLMIFTRTRYQRMDRPDLRRGSQLTFVNATYELGGLPLEVVTTHFDWPTRRNFPGQPRDLAYVASVRPRARMILTGDFNATPWSAELRRLDHSLGLTRRDRGVATFPAQVFGRPWPLPFLPIDHVYAGPGWATVSVRRGPWLGSDHYPLIVTLAPVR